MVGINDQINSESKILEPFTPGSYKEYDIVDNGKVKLVLEGDFHKPGDRPSFTPFLPYESKVLLIYKKNRY